MKAGTGGARSVEQDRARRRPMPQIRLRMMEVLESTRNTATESTEFH